jgi:hypothetical protein
MFGRIPPQETMVLPQLPSSDYQSPTAAFAIGCRIPMGKRRRRQTLITVNYYCRGEPSGRSMPAVGTLGSPSTRLTVIANGHGK